MGEHQLKVNQNFELLVKDSPFKGNYLSKIADISNDKVKVEIPFVRGEIVPLRINLAVEMYFTGEVAAYSYKTKIIDREFASIPLLILKYPEYKQRIQRREFFRLEVKKKISYRVLDIELGPISEKKKTTTIDISGGGLKMVTDEILNKGTLLELYLDIPELRNIVIIAKVASVFDLPEGMAIGVEFIEIDNYIREQIIAWLFDYQRELRQKGML